MSSGAVTASWQLTPLTALSARCLSTKPCGKYSLNSQKKRRVSLHPFTGFVFQLENCLTYLRVFLHLFLGSLSLRLIFPLFRFALFLRKRKASGKTWMCFAIQRAGDRISSLRINCRLEKIQLCCLWQAEDVLALEHRAPLFVNSIVGHVAWSKDTHWSKTLTFRMTRHSLLQQIVPSHCK